MESLSKCPICEGENFSDFLACTDYTVSKKEFKIVSCDQCQFRFTNPRPGKDEIGKYYESEEYISHSNTSKGFINYLYQTVRKYTLIKKLQLINRQSEKGALLDIGCGTGEFLNTCEKGGWRVNGIEPGISARNFAKENYGLNVFPEEKIKEFEDKSFDVITMWHVLEHVHDLNDRLLDLKRLLKENGTLIIAVPNCNSLDASTYGRHWAAYDLPRHLYHFRPEDIEKAFKKINMRLNTILPMRFDSFYVSLLSEKYKSGKSKYIRAFWNGLRSNFAAIKTGKKFSSQIYILKSTH